MSTDCLSSRRCRRWRSGSALVGASLSLATARHDPGILLGRAGGTRRVPLRGALGGVTWYNLGQDALKTVRLVGFISEPVAQFACKALPTICPARPTSTQ